MVESRCAILELLTTDYVGKPCQLAYEAPTVKNTISKCTRTDSGGGGHHARSKVEAVVFEGVCFIDTKDFR